jgi:hypothetical protein
MLNKHYQLIKHDYMLQIFLITLQNNRLLNNLVNLEMLKKSKFQWNMMVLLKDMPLLRINCRNKH